MRPRIPLAVSREYRDLIFPANTLRKIEAVCDIIEALVPAAPDAEFLRAHARSAEIVANCWGTQAIDGPTLAGAPALKLIAHAAGTVKPMMSEDAWRRGIRVTGAAQATAIGVAEFCLGLRLTAPKRVYWLADRIRQGYWSRADDLFGKPFETYRQRVGIIGASHVGRRLTELLRAMGCAILIYHPYWSRGRIEALGATKAETLDEIFRTCRVVSLNVPTTKDTERMIRGSHFALLRDGSLFINTARGILVDQDEMVEQLRRGRFVACLDVTVPEPLAIDHPLRRLPNLLIMPHVEGAVGENLMRIGEFIAEEIERYVGGRKLLGEVTRDQLDTTA